MKFETDLQLSFIIKLSLPIRTYSKMSAIFSDRYECFIGESCESNQDERFSTKHPRRVTIVTHSISQDEQPGHSADLSLYIDVGLTMFHI